jgi:hypothetical protein
MRWLGEVGHDIAGPDLKQPDTDNEHLMQYVEGVFHLPYRRRTKIKDRAPRTWKALTPEDALQTQVKWVLDTRDMGEYRYKNKERRI